MENELKIKYDHLIQWLKYKKDKIVYEKGCVLMNNDVTGFISSKLCQEIFGKENTLNVLIPCYSNIEYLTKSTQFSKNCGVESKNIGLKQIYDDIIELDYDQKEFIDDGDKIKDYLRDLVIDVLCMKNKSFRLDFKKSFDGYEVIIHFLDHVSKFCDSEDSYPTYFSEEEIKEIAKHFEIDV